MTWPQVFVSYAHDSQRHKRSVRRLCELLAKSGIDIRVDCWVAGERRDWQVWATTQILEADFVIIIASPACLQVGDGAVTSGTHPGLQSEMRTLRELYHRAPDKWTKKMLPVVLPGRSVDEIPLFLQPYTADHFIVPSITPAGAKDLLRVITGPPRGVRYPSPEPSKPDGMSMQPGSVPCIVPGSGPLPGRPPQRHCPDGQRVENDRPTARSAHAQDEHPV